MLVDGKPELHREGVYVLDYRTGKVRHTESVGSDGVKALDAARRKRLELDAIAAGIVAKEEPGDSQLTLRKAVDGYLNIIQANKEERTYRAYRPVLSQFCEVCRKTRLADVGRQDLIDYNIWCARQPGRNGTGESGVTRYHKLTIIVQMLKHYGIPSPLRRADWPKRDRSNRTPYQDESLRALLDQIPYRDQVRYRFYLMSGFRDQEGVHITWRDVNFDKRTVAVTAKLHWGFKPKGHEERVVTVSDEMVEMLKAWKPKNARPDDLLFPTSTGHPDTGMHERLKNYAWKLRMNCGHCIHHQELKDGTRKVNRCAEGPYCSKWDMHKFRHTWATKMLRGGTDVESLRMMLGHKDLATTMRYLHALGLDSVLQGMRAKGIFNGWGVQAAAAAAR